VWISFQMRFKRRRAPQWSGEREAIYVHGLNPGDGEQIKRHSYREEWAPARCRVDSAAVTAAAEKAARTGHLRVHTYTAEHRVSAPNMDRERSITHLRRAPVVGDDCSSGVRE